MKRLLKISLVAGLLAGSLAALAQDAGTAPASTVTNEAGVTTPAVPAAQPSKAPLNERIAAWVERKTHLSKEMVVLIISALPIVELRGSIPVGIAVYKMSWWSVFLISVVGNMIPVPLIVLLLRPLAKACQNSRLGKWFFDWVYARARRKASEVEKYELLGLAIFVAIPLPATGAWTGAMIAGVLGIPMIHALWSILLGVAIAGVIMTVLSLLGWIGATIAGVALIGLAVSAMLPMFRKDAKAG